MLAENVLDSCHANGLSTNCYCGTVGRIKGFVQVPNCQAKVIFLQEYHYARKWTIRRIIPLIGYFARTLVELRYYYEVQPISLNGSCF